MPGLTPRMLARWTFLLFAPLSAGSAAAAACPPDSVRVGTVCVDRYEASVWSVPDPTTSNKALVAKLKKGTVTLADLAVGGATQLGCESASTPFDHVAYPPNFPRDGSWFSPPTPGVYSASVPGVLPSACITWYQAQQACLLSGKRLLTNAEWQAAVAGTFDPGATDDGATTCATQSAPARTGERTACVSNWGAHDLVGNVWEWVADWAPSPTPCDGLGGFLCLGGPELASSGPGALIRGGGFSSSAIAGAFAVGGFNRPSGAYVAFGLRCAR